MKKSIMKYFVAAVTAVMALSLAAPAVVYGYNPTLTMAQSGNGTVVTISGGQPNAAVVITYTVSGSSLSNTITGTTDYNGSLTTMISSANISQVSATVGGVPAYTSNSGGGCYGNCTGNLSLSQTSVSLNVGQTTAVTAYASSSIYISNNSNSSVASATASGNQITISANQNGNTTIQVCSGAYNTTIGCGSIYVTVSGYNNNCSYYGNCGNGNLPLSQTSLSLGVGQSTTLYVANGYASINYNLYVSSNSNSSVVSASASGNQVYLNGLASGSATLAICSSTNNQCANVYVTVGGSGNSLSLNPSTVSMGIGQSATVTISGGGSYYISNNSNQAIATANISGSSLVLYAVNPGSTTITVCQYSYSTCGSVYVTVLNSGSGSSITLSPSSVTMSVGQSNTVYISGNNGYGNYFISQNGNPSVASANISGTTLTVYGLANGSTTLAVCQYNSSNCAYLTVTVLGSGSNVLNFTPSNPALNVGQSVSVSIYSPNNYYSSYYVSSNSNPSVVSTNLSGNTLTLSGLSYGSSTITVCQNSYSQCGTLYVNVGNNGGYGNLYFPSVSLPQPYVSQYYSSQLQVSGGTAPYTYTIASGNLPFGLSLSSSGQLFGTPQNTQQASFTVRASDNYGKFATANFTLTPICNNGTGCVLGATQYNNGALILVNGAVYIVYKNTQTGFANAAAFLGLGYSFSNVTSAGATNLVNSGYVVQTPNTNHPWGSWIISNGTVYFMSDQGIIPVPDWNTFLNNGGQINLIVPANSYDFSRPVLPVMTYNDPRLR